MGLLIIIASLFLIGILYANYQDKKRNKMKQNVIAKCEETGLKISQCYIGENMKTGIAFDESNKKLCLIDKTPSDFITRTIPYRDILSSEIIEDGINTIKTSRSSQVGGALVGGLLLGGVGAIVGGLSGSKSTSAEKVKKIELHITVNDTQQPRHVILFLNHETKKSGIQKFTYNKAIEDTRHWHSLISVLIKQADNEDKIVEKETAATIELAAPSIKISIADEISKLVKLLDQNIITESEFRQQKTKLLGNS